MSKTFTPLLTRKQARESTRQRGEISAWIKSSCCNAVKMNHADGDVVSARTTKSFPRQCRRVNHPSEVERRGGSPLRSTEEHNALRNLPQCFGPIRALDNPIHDAATAAVSHQASTCFAHVSAVDTRPSLLGSIVFADGAKKTSDNHQLAQFRNDGEQAKNLPSAAASDCRLTPACHEGGGQQISCVSTFSTESSATGYAANAVPQRSGNYPCVLKAEWGLSWSAEQHSVGDEARTASPADVNIYTRASLHCCGSRSSKAHVDHDAFKNVSGLAMVNTAASVSGCELPAAEKKNGFFQATGTLTCTRLTENYCRDRSFPFAAAGEEEAVHRCNQKSRLVHTRDTFPNGLSNTGHPSGVSTGSARQSEQQYTQIAGKRTRRWSSASSGTCLPAAREEPGINGLGSSPAESFHLTEQKSVPDQVRQGRARSAPSAWWWDTGGYPYPDSCTPPKWGRKACDSVESGTESDMEQSRHLRVFRQVSSPEVARLLPPAFPGTAMCSKAGISCCGLPRLDGFTLSPSPSPGIKQLRAGGSGNDWLAVARGRDSVVPFCGITLEEAAGDALCNPHHELQSLADVLRGEEGPPPFLPTTLLTNDLRGLKESCRDSGGVDFLWHDAPVSAPGHRWSSGSLPNAASCAASCDSPFLPAYADFQTRRTVPTCTEDTTPVILKFRESSLTTSARTRAPAALLPASIAAMLPLTDAGYRQNTFSVSSSDSGKMRVRLTAASPMSDVTGCCSCPEVSILPDNSLVCLKNSSTCEENAARILRDEAQTSFNVLEDVVAKADQHREKPASRAAADNSQFPSSASTAKISGANNGLHNGPCPLSGDITAAQRDQHDSPTGLSTVSYFPNGRSERCPPPTPPHLALLPTPPPPSPALPPTPSPGSHEMSKLSVGHSASSLPSVASVVLATLLDETQKGNNANIWQKTDSVKPYGLATGSPSEYSSSNKCSSFPETSVREKTIAASPAKVFPKKELCLHDIGDELAKEAGGAASTNASTASSVCGGISCVTSPLSPTRGSPSTALAATTTTFAAATTSEVSERTYQQARPPSLEQSTFSLPSPNKSCLLGLALEQNEASSSMGTTRDSCNKRNGEASKDTNTTAKSTNSMLDSCDSNTACENSQSSCRNAPSGTCPPDCSGGTAAKVSSGAAEPFVSSKQLLFYSASCLNRPPVSPADLSQKTHAKNKRSCLESAALPAAAFATSIHVDHDSLQPSQCAAAAVGSCGSGTASESVPTPTTAGQSSHSPLEFSPLSSEGDATTGSHNVALGLATGNAHRDFFSATNTDACRDTPSSINGCVLSTAATALRFVELFSGQEKASEKSETSAHPGSSSGPPTEGADSTRQKTGFQACLVPTFPIAAHATNTAGVVNHTMQPLPLSADLRTRRASHNEVLIAFHHNAANNMSSVQAGPPAVPGKPATELLIAVKPAENTYRVNLPPAVQTSPPLPCPESASPASRENALSTENLERIPQESKPVPLKYVLAGTGANCRYTGISLEQQPAASLQSKNPTQPHQQWLFSSSEGLQPQQQHTAGNNIQASGPASARVEYTDRGLADFSADSGISYICATSGEEIIAKERTQYRDINGASVGKLRLAEGIDSASYLPADGELVEYEVQWEGGHGSACELGDAGPTAVPVRTRKGFRKPLPLPQEMLACPGELREGDRGNEPVLQYDVSSREWRVFWVENRLARYKVFQAKKFGKERAQQLAEEWYHRARAGDVTGSSRGLRTGVRSQVNPKSKKLKVEI